MQLIANNVSSIKFFENDRKKNEIIIAPFDDKKIIAKAFKDSRFTKSSAEAFEKKLTSLSAKQKSEHSQRCTFNFEDGGSVTVLFVEKNIETFYFHSEIRKNLKETIKNKEGVIVSIKKLSKSHQEVAISAISSLQILESWVHPQYGQRAKASEKKLDSKPSALTFVSSISPSAAKGIFKKSETIAIKNNLVRTLACTPGNFLTPKEYRAILSKRTKENKIKYEFLGSKSLEKLNAGGFLAVLSADPNSQGGIAHLTYKPSKAKKVISLVGKGLCFDTGGYNIKTGDYMYTMHRDMTGSAVALALIEALAALKAPFEVHAYLALAENHISPTGFKPNDVVTAMDGTSIEVVNTDAEGRMVLCDTLHYSTKVDPDLILDFATLTGGAVYSIGTKRSAVFSNDPKLGELAVRCGDESGERCWDFPVGGDYLDNIKSDVADILQCSNARGVDHINAASFLAHFVGKYPWIHMDLSSEENKGGLGLISSDVTGFGVRWALKVIEKFFKTEL